MDEFEPGDLLTKMECCTLFCEKLRIGTNSYYKYYRPYIKFKNYGLEKDDEGNIRKRLPRIPYEIALGLINLMKEDRQPEDPSMQELKKFMKNETRTEFQS